MIKIAIGKYDDDDDDDDVYEEDVALEQHI